MQTLGRFGLSLCLGFSLATIACTDDGGTEDDSTETSGPTGDGDGDPTGDGDGDPTGDGDGDPTGDGDGDPTGDGDGDPTGDGDGDPTGDGDGDPTGDGDGDPTGDGDGDPTGDGDGDGDCVGEGVGVCDAEPASDAFTLDNIDIDGDCLTLGVSYSGGCAEHSFSTCWNELFAESDPVQADVWVSHDDMDDPCDGIEQDTWVIDLTPLKESWQEAYQQQSGTIIVHVAGDSVNYDF